MILLNIISHSTNYIHNTFNETTGTLKDGLDQFYNTFSELSRLNYCDSRSFSYFFSNRNLVLKTRDKTNITFVLNSLSSDSIEKITSHIEKNINNLRNCRHELSDKELEKLTIEIINAIAILNVLHAKIQIKESKEIKIEKSKLLTTQDNLVHLFNEIKRSRYFDAKALPFIPVRKLKSVKQTTQSRIDKMHTILGKYRALDPRILTLLEQENIPLDLLDEFLSISEKAKEKNVTILQSQYGQFISDQDEHNVLLIETLEKLQSSLINLTCDKNKIEAVTAMIDLLYIIVSASGPLQNFQIHSDTMMFFLIDLENFQLGELLGREFRYLSNIATRVLKIEQELEALDKSKSDSLETKQRRTFLEKSKGYIERARSELVEKASWQKHPAFPDNPWIKQRIISLMLPTCDSKDVSVTLNLNILSNIRDEKHVIQAMEFLHYFENTMQAHTDWASKFLLNPDSNLDIPKNIKTQLDLMDFLDDIQKGELLCETVKFSYEINRKFLLALYRIGHGVD